MKKVSALRIGNADVLPLVEGGKGISATSGKSAGAWAASGGVGTVSIVNADSYDENGLPIPQIYHGKTRQERHEELVKYAIDGGIEQVRIAHEVAGGKGRIHANILWEMGASERVIEGVLNGAQGLIQGLTCGAGMPYRLAGIAARHKVYYYPIVSSWRAFRALWKRSYSKVPQWLGGVVYEDPWRAGGHNGLSKAENPKKPEGAYVRVKPLRDVMRQFGLDQVPIIVAGGVWRLDEWEDWIDNPELGPIAFQFGTRPLLTQESPIPEAWKQRLLHIQPNDVHLNRFSPTGFYSSAVNNAFLQELDARSKRQIPFAVEPSDEFSEICPAVSKHQFFIKKQDVQSVKKWIQEGFKHPLRTPDSTLIFVTPEKASQILADQRNCMGCLSMCKFSSWKEADQHHTTGQRPDPRSFCIQKTLQEIAHAQGPDGAQKVENNLLFAGTNAWRFARDPYYRHGFIPTVHQLIDRIMTGK